MCAWKQKQKNTRRRGVIKQERSIQTRRMGSKQKRVEKPAGKKEGHNRNDGQERERREGCVNKRSGK